MNSSNSQESLDKIADDLGYICKKGVRLWSENGQLRYKAPKGALTEEEIERLRTSKGQIVAFLEKVTGAETAEPKIESRPRPDRAPLAFSQLARWHSHRLSERHAIRQIASATRLRGRLNVDSLKESLAQIVHRHHALRTRLVVIDGVPVQEIAESGDYELRVDDLTALSLSFRELEVERLIEHVILEPIDFAVGPLFGVRLLKLRDDEHVLIVAMEHMISDLFSLNIILRDLLTAYTQASRGRAFCLPALPMQFADYAVWQRSAHTSWLEKHGAYWDERLAGCQRLRFPEDPSLQTETRLGWGTAPFRIDTNLKAELRDWCRQSRTTLVMGVFTAYVALVLRWCNASEAVIQYQSDCRVSPQIENTIGFFASVLYLRMALLEEDNFADLMNRITGEYCKAYEHLDFSFIAAQVPRPAFTGNSTFNWVPQGSKIDLAGLDESEDAIACSPVPFPHPMLKKLDLDNEPLILLYETSDEVVGGVYFPLNRFSLDAMDRFGRNLLKFIEALLRQPEVRVKDILLL